MSDSSRYVQTNINNSGLIPQAVPASYPILWSTNGQQLLTAVINQYQPGDNYSVYYAAKNKPIASTLQTMFSQTVSVDTVGGIDLETKYAIAFSVDGALNYTIEWLDADNGVFQTFIGSAANIAALMAFINTNITTVTATQATTTLSIAPNSATPNQLVRLSFSNLSFSQYTFTPANEPANATAVFDALIATGANEKFVNFYCQVIEENLFYADLTAGASAKTAAEIALATAVEATEDMGDNRKVIVISSQDPAILNSDSSTDVMAVTKTLKLERSMIIYYAGNNLASGLVSARFGLNNGDRSWVYQTVIGVAPLYLSESQINVIYQIDDQGNLSPTCKNGNYYDSTASLAIFYPGVTPSALPFDVTIVADHMARDARYAQIQLSSQQSNLGQDIPYNQTGINMQVATIQGVMDSYLQAGKISPVDSTGKSCVINAPTFAQIQANPVLANQFKNRVLSGITIDFVPAGSINKVIETFQAVI